MGKNQHGEDSILGVMGWVLPRFWEPKAAEVGQSIFESFSLFFFLALNSWENLPLYLRGDFHSQMGSKELTARNAVYSEDQAGKGAFTKPTI